MSMSQTFEVPMMRIGKELIFQKGDKGKAQLTVKVEKKSEELKPEGKDKGKAKSEQEEKKVEEVKEVKRYDKTIASIWKLLMNSKTHREALVMALDHKKIYG